MASQYQLIMRSGPTPGAAFMLEGDQITIGRDPTNTITINDAEISRRHARLTYQGGKYILEDLGSTNGTFVNGQRLAGPRVLKSGEVVSFGEQIVLVFETTSFDPGATVVSPVSSRASSVPSVSRPIQPPPPPPPVDYAGSVPASPPVTTEVVETRSFNPVIIAVGVAVIMFLCMCGLFFWWVDATFRWCVFFPFLNGCP